MNRHGKEKSDKDELANGDKSGNPANAEKDELANAEELAKAHNLAAGVGAPAAKVTPAKSVAKKRPARAKHSDSNVCVLRASRTQSAI